MERLSKIKSDLGFKNYAYTVNNGCLTAEQRDFYEENGFLIVNNLLKDQDIEKWKKRFLEYCNGNIPLQIYAKIRSPGMQIVRDISLAKKNKNGTLKGEAFITKIQDFQFDEILHSYCTNPDLIPYLKSFCGDNIKSMHTIFLNKPPNMGANSRHPFHQDLAYFPFGPTNQIVAAWAALQDCNKQNGSLNILAKTHKGPFYNHEYPEWQGAQNKAYFGIQGFDKSLGQRIDLEMKKGDIVFFHPLLIHGSSENKTSGFRKSICCHFASAECEYLPMQGTIQQQVGKQVMSYMVKKVPNLTDFHSYWRYKASLVSGRSFQGKI